MSPSTPSALDLATSVRSGERTAIDIVEESLAAIEALNPKLRAFLKVDGNGARQRAEELDAARQAGETLGPLAGVPIALKDNLCTRGLETTCGSRILEGYRPPYDATVVERLRGAGAVIVGKTNLDEFAMGSSTENSAFGPTSNPWDASRVPGGSSGGSAAAVAAGLVPVALGSDTGGSIRQPASLCGVVGLKPSYGRISRFGLVAFGSSLDQIGPLTSTVAEAAALFSVLAGPDPRDGTCDERPAPDSLAALEKRDVSRLRIGVPRAAFGAGVEASVTAACRASLDALSARGARLIDLDLDWSDLAIPTYYLVATSEASSNLARYDGVRYGSRAAGHEDLIGMITASRGAGFGPEVKRRILLGTYALSAGYYDAYYRKATQARALMGRQFAAAFEQVDVIATPTSPTPAFPIGEKSEDPLQMYLCDVFSVPANLVGLPGLSVPCGASADGLPIGLQLMARRFDETTLLQAGACLEDARPEPLGLPPIHRLAKGGAR